MSEPDKVCCMCRKSIEEGDSLISLDDAMFAFPKKIRDKVSDFLWSLGIPDTIVTAQGQIPRFMQRAHFECVRHAADGSHIVEKMVKASLAGGGKPAVAGKAGPKSPLTKLAKELGGVVIGDDDELDDEKDSDDPLAELPRLRPSQVLHDLDLDIIGQKHAKMVLSVALCDHIKRLRLAEAPLSDAPRGAIPEKSNVLLIGPSGCGKTEIISTLAELLDVPFAKTLATGITVAGYYGEDVEEVLYRLYKEAGEDVRLAERGIVYIDEVDKLARPDGNNYGDDIRGKGVQQALLEIIRGTEVVIGQHPRTGEDIILDTRNILFVFSGSFEGLEKIVNSGSASIGFGASVRSSTDFKLGQEVEDEALIKFGLTTEFVGRIPVRATLEALTESEIVRVLTEPRKALVSQYVSLYAADGLSLDFDEDALTAIAAKAMKMKTGVRALRGIMENLLRPLSFDLPDLQKADPTVRGVQITREYVLGEAEALIIYGDPPRDGKKLRPVAAVIRKQYPAKKHRRGKK